MFSIFKRFSLSSTQLVIILSLYFATILNYAFYREVISLQSFNVNLPETYFVLTIPLVLFCALIIVIQILSLPILHKVIIPFLLIISSAISYNEIFFSIFFDKDMLDNVLQTNTAESMRMMTTSYISWIVILGIIPSLLYIATKVKYKSFLREIMTRIATILLSMLIILGVAKFFYQDYASFFRNNKNVAHLILPSNFVASSIKKIRHLQRENIPYTQIDVDAQQEKPDNYRHVTVLIVGETTRAQNWGLNGYKRQTTPLLAKRGEEIFNFSKVSSCGTATAISVPCMFSAFTRENYDAAKAAKQDNILDILQRSNIDLMWIDNNSDCKGVCERIPNKTVINLNLPEFCRNGECLDNIMLPELDKVLDEQNEKDLVVILHTIGSHGPTYYERYTKEYRHFEPTCDTNEINRCNDQQLVNTYDNTIVYQDQFIDKVIQRLENKDNWESAVFYVSDHGESLGESGIYLHGAPYSIAPDYQTKVPMIMWFSKAFLKNEPFDFECLRENSQKQNYSHDNLFHTMFSLMDMDTDLGSYNVHLDILAQCKK